MLNPLVLRLSLCSFPVTFLSCDFLFLAAFSYTSTACLFAHLSALSSSYEHWLAVRKESNMNLPSHRFAIAING